MNKITWILIWSVTALLARKTTAFQCHVCNSLEHRNCGDPFVPSVQPESCSAEIRQCGKLTLRLRGASGEITVVQRGCAPPGVGNNGCQSETQMITLPDGTRGLANGQLCLCVTNLCNGAGTSVGASGPVRQEIGKVTVSTVGKVTRPGGNAVGPKTKGNKGEQFQPKMELLMFTVATALMSILFN